MPRRPERMVDRLFVRYAIREFVYADFLGSGWKYYREEGKIVKFWRRKTAEAFMNELNKAEEEYLEIMAQLNKPLPGEENAPEKTS